MLFDQLSQVAMKRKSAEARLGRGIRSSSPAGNDDFEHVLLPAAIES